MNLEPEDRAVVHKSAAEIAAEILSTRTKEIHENGDVYDEDTGEHLGTLDFQEADPALPDILLPAQISIYFHGYWYVFKPQSRYKDTPEEKDS